MGSYREVMPYCNGDSVWFSACVNKYSCKTYGGEITINNITAIDFACATANVYVKNNVSTMYKTNNLYDALDYLLNINYLDLEDTLKTIKLKSEICKKK